MTVTDLGPAAGRLCALIENVPDQDLGRPSPCTEYTVGDLLDHIRGVTIAWGGAAVKAEGESSTIGPSGDASKLDPDWRTSLPRRLRELAEAWHDPEAWTGTTRVGGNELPGEIAGMALLGELVIHGWDLATATGQPFQPDPASCLRSTTPCGRLSARAMTKRADKHSLLLYRCPPTPPRSNKRWACWDATRPGHPDSGVWESQRVSAGARRVSVGHQGLRDRRDRSDWRPCRAGIGAGRPRRHRLGPHAGQGRSAGGAGRDASDGVAL